MTRDEWEVLYELHGILTEIVMNSAVYSGSLSKRLAALAVKLEELPIDEDN